MGQIVQQIWHGDSRDLCKKFKVGRVNCVITDPPFGIDNQSNMATTVDGAKMARKIANDETPEQALAVFTEVMNTLLPRTSDDADVYVFTAGAVLKEWLVACDNLFFMHNYARKAIIVWEKDGPGMGDLESWGQSQEYILFYKKGRRLSSDQRRSGVLHVPQLRPKQLVHPHEKPEALLEMLLRHSTDVGDFVVDPFGGSGSLARAARNLDRTCVTIEYDEFNYLEAKKKFDATAGGLF